MRPTAQITKPTKKDLRDRDKQIEQLQRILATLVKNQGKMLDETERMITAMKAHPDESVKTIAKNAEGAFDTVRALHAKMKEAIGA